LKKILFIFEKKFKRKGRKAGAKDAKKITIKSSASFAPSRSLRLNCG